MDTNTPLYEDCLKHYLNCKDNNVHQFNKTDDELRSYEQIAKEKIISDYGKLLETGKYSDLKINVEGKVIKVHKCILSGDFFHNTNIIKI